MSNVYTPYLQVKRSELKWGYSLILALCFLMLALLGCVIITEHSVSVGISVTAVALCGTVFFFLRMRHCKKGIGQIFNRAQILVDPHYFAENKDNPKLVNRVDRLAVERFCGDYKQALRYIVETADLTREERLWLILGRENYERQYLVGLYGNDLMLVAQESRKDVLTMERILQDLSGKTRSSKIKPESLMITEAACTQKRTFTRCSETDDSTTELLYFDNYGAHEATAVQYFLTEEGNRCYIVCQPKKEKMQVIMSYNTKDWVLDEELQHLKKQLDFPAP